MKICFVCNEYPPAPQGGIGSFVQGLGQRLAAAGQTVFVIGYLAGARTAEWSSDDGVRVLRLPEEPRSWLRLNWGPWDLDYADFAQRQSLTRQVSDAVKEHGIDLVESYDWNGPLWSPPHRPLIVRLHGANTAHAYYEGQRPSRMLRSLEKRNVAMADRLVAVSQHIGKTTLAALGLSGKEFEVIPNGVDTELFCPQGVERNRSEVLYVGSIARRKGVMDLLAAAPEVLRDVPDARFRFVGNLPEGAMGSGPLAEQLRALPANYRQRIEFPGRVPQVELPKYYSSATVVVIPSRAEAFGLTCAEAMACGAAVVMTSLASGPELVEHEKSGLLANPGNPHELASAIVRLLTQSGLRERLGAAARQRARTHFDLTNTAMRNLDFYQTVKQGYGV
ncbi:MAG: glycosyltransferase family 4 protein [Acidobacteriales bacterium]|nr:glycosyltransferase family 4 protein [Terriglobales bacterium]